MAHVEVRATAPRLRRSRGAERRGATRLRGAPTDRGRTPGNARYHEASNVRRCAVTIPRTKWPSWPPRRRSEGENYLIGDWGHATVIQHLDERDVLIEYDTTSLEARRKALEFAEALVAQVREQSPGMQAEFIAANDHY